MKIDKEKSNSILLKGGAALFGVLAILSMLLAFVVAKGEILGVESSTSTTGFDLIKNLEGSNANIRSYLIVFLVVASAAILVSLASVASMSKAGNRILGLITGVLGVGLVVVAIMVFKEIKTEGFDIGIASASIDYGIGAYLHLIFGIGVAGTGALIAVSR